MLLKMSAVFNQRNNVWAAITVFFFDINPFCVSQNDKKRVITFGFEHLCMQACKSVIVTKNTLTVKLCIDLLKTSCIIFIDYRNFLLTYITIIAADKFFAL